jgi:hypothetical protein
MVIEKTVSITCPTCGRIRVVPAICWRVAQWWEEGGFCSEACAIAAKATRRIVWGAKDLWRGIKGCFKNDGVWCQHA